MHASRGLCNQYLPTLQLSDCPYTMHCLGLKRFVCMQDRLQMEVSAMTGDILMLIAQSDFLLHVQ